ncbi:MAG: STAS domain-containing protein [Opitutales bacterium]
MMGSDMTQPAPMPASVPQSESDGCLLRVKGDILSTNAEERIGALAEEIAARPICSRLTIDLRSAKMIDSMGLNALLSVIKQARASGAEVTLEISSRSIERLFRLSHLDAIATVELKDRRRR